jgi:hypothetical protein
MWQSKYVHEIGEEVMTSTPKKAAKKADWKALVKKAVS